SQPKTAVFQWPALQRPIRAARLSECLRGDISGSPISLGLEERPHHRRLGENPKCGHQASWGSAFRTLPRGRGTAYPRHVTRAPTLDEPALLERMQLVAEAFRPSAPIDRRSLFSGRTDQIAELFSVVAQPGQHAVVYGERGVGKTSLAAVVGELLASSGVLTARATCDSGDDFSSVWRKALSEIALPTPTRGIGFAATTTDVATPASAVLGDAGVTPPMVARGLEALAPPRPLPILLAAS